jgi:uncharacterized membrane protein YfhO
VTSVEPNRVEINVKSRCGGVLVLSDAYFPGWTATVDGRAATIYPTDLAFRGVTVPKGVSTVVFRYRPRSFLVGSALAGFAALSLAVLVVLGRRLRPWAEAKEDATLPEPVDDPRELVP